MRKIKTEIVLLGSGSAVMLAAQRLASLGTSFVLVNPLEDFGIGDIRPYDGLGLWNAAYRGMAQGSSQSTPSLAELYELLEHRVRECFPAPLAQADLRRTECWSVLSSTPVHQVRTQELEKEFFKIERKRWSSGHFRLVNPEHVAARFKKIEVGVSDVAQVEGAIVRSYAIWWDAARMGLHLNQFVRSRFADVCLTKVTLLNRFGRRLVLRDGSGEEVSVEAEKGIFIFLTGELLPHLRSIVSSCTEPWIQGVRKRRREEHQAWFETRYATDETDAVLMELGDTTYRWAKGSGMAVWSVRRGPDGLDRVVDEALRLQSMGEAQTRYTYSVREFFLEWDWKTPLWKETSHDTFWATSFEGDLFKVTELFVEFSASVNNVRSQIGLVLQDVSPDMDREKIWTAGSLEFLRRMHKLGTTISIIGPKPPMKFGTKKNIRFLDRHEVIGMKHLQASRSHEIEFRILSHKAKDWTRLRTEACVAFGNTGVWPEFYEGWASPGTLTMPAFWRWLVEYKQLPGREFAFIGSSNQVMRLACHALDKGVRSCYVIEPEATLKCWRSYRDRFVAKGGRVLLGHSVLRVERDQNSIRELYLKNDFGTMILSADTVVMSTVNDDPFNAPNYWKKGMFFLQRRTHPLDANPDEEKWLDISDWRELYWRISKRLKFADHAEAEGALKTLKLERKEWLAYRKPGKRREFSYSGKILDRDSLFALQSSKSVPKSFVKPRPVASLECFENIPCRACADACPESAIDILKLSDMPALTEDKCTGCGACVAICPSGAALMVHEDAVTQKARFYFSDDSKELWKPGQAIQLLNRKGDQLGGARVVSSNSYEGGIHRILEVETTHVHVWDARNFRKATAGFSAATPEEQFVALQSLKRAWVTLNGVKRLCPVGEPVTVALWQLGVRRFADAFFCKDGSCRLCEVKVDGQPRLACQVEVQEGQNITFKDEKPKSAAPICPCKNLDGEEYLRQLKEGVPPSLARETGGLGLGPCHGKWCLNANQLARGSEKLRPFFPGFEISPWRDLWAQEVAGTKEPKGNKKKS